LQEDAAGKKLFAQTTTQKKIVCLEKIFIPTPPFQKNNGPSLKTIKAGFHFIAVIAATAGKNVQQSL